MLISYDTLSKAPLFLLLFISGPQAPNRHLHRLQVGWWRWGAGSGDGNSASVVMVVTTGGDGDGGKERGSGIAGERVWKKD